MVVTAKRYRLTSRTFRVFGSRALTVERQDAPGGRFTVALAYPVAKENVDLTYRPHFARGGVVRFRVGSKTVRVKRKRNPYFTISAPAGTPISVAPGAAKDLYKNVNGGGATVSSR
jgi:hypothetical protein